MVQKKLINKNLFFSTPLQKIKGIGVSTAETLLKNDFKTMQDLIEHYPYRYEDFSEVKKIIELKPEEKVTIKADVKSIYTRKSARNRRLSITEAILSDETGNVQAIWFNQPYLSTTLIKGQDYYFSGQVSLRNKLQLQGPQFESGSNINQINVGRLVPIYSLPEGIYPKRYRGIIYNLLQNLPSDHDYLPQELKKRLRLISLAEAWRQIHFPANTSELEKARSRLAFDELFMLQLQIAYRRQIFRKTKAPTIPFIQADVKKFVLSLPFNLTLAQKKAAWEIIQDLEKNQPMNRLLQGDVGSGKTVVAAMAAFSAQRSARQTAVLAPTEILCQQHFLTLKKLLEPYEIVVSILTGGTKNKEKKQIYEALKKGKIDVVVGTHALLNEAIKFKSLGLVIVDEQHRFGVKQRSLLRSQKKLFGLNQSDFFPHLLSMTATPIPRTLALTLYGDLAISSINELPPGRQEVATEIISHRDRQKAYALLRKEVLSGRQGFIICPLLEESEVLEVKSAKEEYLRLSKNVFPTFSLALIHGKMASDAKEKIMREFKNGEYQILISTSVVEVGIDVPNATVVLVEGAERFGLAQLHQFRGRVGRGENASFCLLVPTTDAVPERLRAISENHDGFKLAELDLKFRGMGEISGLKQSGFLEVKIADPMDIKLIKLARDEAEKIIQADPGLSKHTELFLRMQKNEEVVHPE